EDDVAPPTDLETAAADKSGEVAPSEEPSDPMAELIEPTPMIATARIEPTTSYPPIPKVDTLANAAASGNGIAQFQLAQQQLADGNLKG
ncbi:MAG TPA: hypothetical protein DHU81_14420, partial [Hyphomonas sp.]|nr:hypothetical protein [Hyphomonas sp.]